MIKTLKTTIMEPEEQRKKLALMIRCRGFLYHANILTDREAKNVFDRIRKYQDKFKINISEEQMDSVDFTYKD